ncbi:GntR family transcriptional regulator [Cellulomonas citrea]|uniref:GntR family transcriptional regulator n=1 Tax=Cellulomonas citrea TaxID=1909423 RepID=UPI00191565B0|nr:GntR family transcriptional regulator [Cellulomonas citrea]
MSTTERVLLRDQATDLLRDAIVSGRLEPGQVIKDTRLASDLGLSVAPVRQALARLVEEGLVESKPQSRTRVTPVTLAAVRDALAVVGAMHQLATREGAALATSADIEAMRSANAQFRAAIEDGDTDRALDADDALHAVLVARYGNRAVASTIDRYTPTIRRLERRRFTAAQGRTSAAVHDELIEAVVDGRVDEAVAITGRIWSAL